MLLLLFVDSQLCAVSVLTILFLEMVIDSEIFEGDFQRTTKLGVDCEVNEVGHRCKTFESESLFVLGEHLIAILFIWMLVLATEKNNNVKEIVSLHFLLLWIHANIGIVI